MKQQQLPKTHQSSPQPDLSVLKSNALIKLTEAAETIRLYRQAKESRFPYGVVDNDDFDSLVQFEIYRPYFLGAPGEVCDTCGGSGRKK